LEDTIVSQATPTGFSAISLIRISGDKALTFSRKLSNKKTNLKHLKPTKLAIHVNNKKIDEVVFTAFYAPKSYTGEDVVEVSCHGNPNISESIINEIISFGGRLAHPGEYTKRAFLNGKLDLLQAESVGLLIKSKSIDAAERQTKNLLGGITKKINKVKSRLLFCLSTLEFEFDVSEEEYLTNETVEKIKKALKSCETETSRLKESFIKGHAYTKGLKISVIGKPNVGKSTLVNKLININKSITSDIPGTTRDLIITETTLDGIPVTLIDTAGIHNTKDKIEKEGIKRSLREIKNSDIIISVFTNTDQPVDIKGFKKQILVYNKEDLQPYKGTKKTVVSVSAKKESGLDALKQNIKEKISFLKTNTNESLITTIRQKEAVDSLNLHITQSLNHFTNKPMALEIIAFEIRTAISKIDLFTGKTTTNDILKKVFSDFCVGK
tara:strand:- start:6550 stop:7866 length:1317 start_codon:yes stop_codon:yes gene_type:complete